MNEIKLNPTQALDVIKAGIMADIPVLLLGTPGIGKTQIAEAVGQALVKQGRFSETITLIFSQDPPIEHRQSRVKGDKLEFVFSDKIPFDRPVFIFIDELGDLPAYEAAIAGQLIHERKWGDRKLAEGSYVMAGGNPADIGTSGQAMPTQILDRFMVLNVQPSAEQWCDYAHKKGFHPNVISFVRTMLATQQIDVTNRYSQDDFCGGSTPRSLEKLSKIEAIGYPTGKAGLAVAQGCLGVDIGHRYFVYRDIANIDIDLLLSNPEGAPIPEELGQKYAMMAFLANCATVQTFAKIYKVAERLDRPMAVCLISDCQKRCPDIKNGSTWMKVVQNYGDIL